MTCLFRGFTGALILWTCLTGSSIAASHISDSIYDRYDDGDTTPIYASILHDPQYTSELLQTLKDVRASEFPIKGIVFVEASAARLIQLDKIKQVKIIEEISPNMVRTVTGILSSLYRVALYQDNGFYDFGVLTISLGVPLQYMGREGAGKYTIQHAISSVVNRGIPVVMPIGNEGPENGLINSWALAPEVFIIGAADSTGKSLYRKSSRGKPGQLDGKWFYVAPGVDVVVNHSPADPKSQEMIAAEKRMSSAERGTDFWNNHTVVSGTSFAVVNASYLTCSIAMANKLLGRYLSHITPVKFTEDPFIRVYIDFAADRELEYLKFRLADERRKYLGPNYELDLDRKLHLRDFILQNAVQFDRQYTPSLVQKYLRNIATPVADESFSSAGYGLITEEGLYEYLTSMSFSDLLDVYSNEDDTQYALWKSAAEKQADFRIFSTQEATLIRQYCREYSLILPLNFND